MSSDYPGLALTSMVEIEKKFAEGTWKHDSVEDVRLQLLAEGKKRTEAFVFEELFQRMARRSFMAQPNHVSFGWVAAFYYGALEYWFRLETESDRWNSCDDAFASALQSLNMTVTPTDTSKQPFTVRAKVFRVDCTRKGRFRFRKLDSGGRAGDVVYQSGFRSHYGITTAPCIEDAKGQDFARQQRAIGLLGWLTNYSTAPVSVRRRLMNTVLPGIGLSPIDLDAVFLDGPSGRLHYVEFKRKYPALSGMFGLDEAHVKVARTMKEISVDSLHAILVSPVWTDDADPVRWYLDVANYGDRWAWVVARLDNIGEGPKMSTSGEKSGHHEGERDQNSVPWGHCRLLSRGLAADASALRRMHAFFSTGDLSPLDITDSDALREMTDGSAKAHLIDR